MITYVNGDIFRSNADVIVHGCNCFCTMGAGIARQVARYYPQAYTADKKTPCGSKAKLGTYSSWTGQHYFKPERTVTIVNAYTQWKYGGKTRNFSYSALKDVLPKIKNDFAGKTIALPKIGAGLGGGDWKIIEQIINMVFNDKDVLVYEY